MPTFLTPDEAAEALRTSVRTLERRRLDGSGPKFVKLGGRVLYRPEDIAAWADERTFARTAEAQATA
jgi:predicted DNA-binding transcriptional regulator AlpA